MKDESKRLSITEQFRKGVEKVIGHATGEIKLKTIVDAGGSLWEDVANSRSLKDTSRRWDGHE